MRGLGRNVPDADLRQWLACNSDRFPAKLRACADAHCPSPVPTYFDISSEGNLEACTCSVSGYSSVATKPVINIIYPKIYYIYNNSI